MDQSRGRDSAFLTLVGIPLTFSIANGLAFGIAAHALIKLVRGKITQRTGCCWCWPCCSSRASSGLSGAA
jgi:xanthine/uracil/vitamin C permease (AzgA family)